MGELQTQKNEVAAAWSGVDGFYCLTTGKGLANTLESAPEEVAPALSSLLPEHPEAVVFAGQIHGTTVREVGCGALGVLRLPSCDGLVTARARKALVIRTADCVPLVLVDRESRVCAGLHAGWRGTMENMVGAGIAAAVELGARRDRLELWIGPCIRGDVYEVSTELADEFRGRWGHLGDFSDGRLLDLPRLTVHQAIAAGIHPNRITDSGLCTYSDVTTFFSHRRDGKARGHEFTVCGFCE